jgi:NADPH-dependent curcumin reductase CurA
MQQSSAALRAQVRELRYDCGGRLQYQEDILNGIEQASGAIAGLYRGARFANA